MGCDGPKGCQIIALSTQLQQLQSPSPQKPSSTKTPPMHNFRTITDWRKTKIDHYVNMDGLNWWWCDKHICIDYDGLYVRHKPEHHKGAPRVHQGRRPNDPQPPPATQDRTDRKLKLSQSMKSALLTMGIFTEEQADAIIEQTESTLPQDF